MNIMPQGSQGMGANPANNTERIGMNQVSINSLQMQGEVNKVQNPE
jgi:hypothetical protein